MDDMVRMKEIETQKTATCNPTLCIFIQLSHYIHAFFQWFQFIILRFNLFHYTIAVFIPYIPFHLHSTSHISLNRENQAFPAFGVKNGMQHSTYSSLSFSSLLFYYYSLPMLYRLQLLLYVSLSRLSRNSSLTAWIMLHPSEDDDCIVSEEKWVWFWSLLLDEYWKEWSVIVQMEWQ